MILGPQRNRPSIASLSEQISITIQHCGGVADFALIDGHLHVIVTTVGLKIFTRTWRATMKKELNDELALKLFVHQQKMLNGSSRVVAEDRWRSIGSDGRKQWRDLAKIAFQVIVSQPDYKTYRSGA